MAEWRARCPLPAAAAFTVALTRADRHGTPLAPALAALAADARGDRARRLDDRAAKAAPKIQLVVALLLVPAVLLLVAAALLGALA
jgi:tight adherence protein C